MPKIFSQFKLRQGPSELGSLVGSLLRTYTVVISPLYLKVWVVITGLTITDSQWLRPRKYIAVVASHPIKLLSYAQPVVITFIPY